MPDPAGIVVLAPNWLGDAVMALPSIEDLRRAFQPARLVVAARRSVASMFEMARCVDEVLTLEWRGRIFRRDGLDVDDARLRELGADVAILLPNSFASAWLIKRAEIAERWGYSSDLRSPLLTRAVRKPKGSVHQAQYYQHLVRELGVSNGPLEPTLDVAESDKTAAMALLVEKGWDRNRPLVAVAAGAAYGKAKQWLPRHFVQLVTDLVGTRDASCVLVGSAADAETTGTIREQVPLSARSHVIDLAGATSLRTLAGILSLASACVSNDSGAMHMAAAVGVPLVSLFGPTNDRETAPLPRQNSLARVLVHQVWCRPCMLRECPIDHRCMKGLEPDLVLSAVTDAMSATR